MVAPGNFNLESLVEAALQEALRERGHVNILIAGRTGVGKSTLINSVFQGNFATTGQGRPVTQNTREIKKEGIPISIFDTRGLEMADFTETLQSLKVFISERSRSADANQYVHAAWVCIAEDSRRVEPAEEELVKMLSDRNIPTIVVITKARSDNGFRAEVLQILTLVGLVGNAVRVRAIEEVLDEGITLSPMGLNDLVQATMQVVPDGLKRAFAAAQKVDIDLKKTRSHLIVGSAAASAAGIAAAPIPFSDAVAIIPIQVGMLAGVSATFGLSIDKSLLSTIVGSIVAGSGGTLAGRAIVSNFLKFIPGAGSVAGGTIAAATAGALTVAIGEAYIAVLDMLFLNNNGEPPTTEAVAEAFREKCSKLVIR
ncbi:50S ribosome-binding GTPase [Limnothrix sp. FACHB-708]|uniref:YcjF family protein n=1 Tax=unclassified Limnothrix TaxID=2632864 RepID=UPI0016866EA4|nr:MULTISPECIES: GTPase [unclassified Limnothrix]MBD2553014.1 50S ribosome-binding GTPase [Limnothrix sp. FACHB-708]MBD2589175.1 50S ribosome-binding GTPase [Limnothrix sp. FACHB-406]